MLGIVVLRSEQEASIFGADATRASPTPLASTPAPLLCSSFASRARRLLLVRALRSFGDRFVSALLPLHHSGYVRESCG
jgi:hypothetical protein